MQAMLTAGAGEFQNAQLRLARHYLNKLRTASVAIHRGQASITYGIQLFDREREQIEHWQAYSAERSGEDGDWTRLCQEYPYAGLEVLTIRQNLADRVRWLESGLDAAMQLGNVRSELTFLHELSADYGNLGDTDMAALYAGRLLRRGREVKDSLSIGRGYYALGGVAEDRGLYAEALEQTQAALEIFTELGARTDEGRALHHLGSIALYLADFEQAYHYFSRHLILAETENNMGEVCRGLLSVAQTLLTVEEYAQAEPYIRRAIRLSRALEFQRLLGAGLIMLAQWFGEQDHLDLELKYYKEGIQAARSVGSQRDVIHGLSNSGFARMLKGDLEGALAELKEGLELARQAGIPRFICNLQRNIADTCMALDRPAAARSALKEALSLAWDMGSSYQIVKALTSAVGYWQYMGWNEQAAMWAGNLLGRPEVDPHMFDPICARLEAALGVGTYRQALEEGNALELDQILIDVLGTLDRR